MFILFVFVVFFVFFPGVFLTVVGGGGRSGRRGMTGTNIGIGIGTGNALG